MQAEFALAASELMTSAKAVPRTEDQPNAAGEAFNMTRRFAGQAENSSALVIVNGSSRAVFGPLDKCGRATGVYAYVTPDGLGKGGPVQGTVPGAKNPYQRGHLLSRLLGGPGNVKQNLAPELGRNNQGKVRDWEMRVAAVVRGGLPKEGIPQQNMRIMKYPIYEGCNPVPVKYLLVAFGEKGFNMNSVYVLNK